MLSRSYFKGIESIVLENEFLRAEFLPSYGSKLASLISKKTGKEFLFQSELKELVIPEYGSAFSSFDSSGFDEVFPSINRCPYPEGNRKNIEVPDHGEVWALSWNYEMIGETIKFWVLSPKLQYRFEKVVKLEKNSLKTVYTVVNLADEDFKFIWTPHALLNCDENVKIVVPERMNRIMTAEHSTEHLGEWGTEHNYPVTKSFKTGKDIDMSRVEKVEANNCEKFYFLDKVNKDETCGLEYSTGEKIIYSYDAEKIPYLGVWKTQGGYRGHYNVALEPCTGIYDDLYVASEIRKVAVVEKNKEFFWNFNITIEA
jgi:galactose mutarotase-like enzyme